MGMCYAPDCNHTYKSGCKMYRFPGDILLKQKWEKFLRRADAKPTRFSVVCSCHFVDGNKENLPTLYEHNKRKMFLYSSPEEKPKRKIIRLSPSASAASTSNADVEPIQCTAAVPATSTSRKTISASVEVENYFLKQEVEALRLKLQKLTVAFSYVTIENNDHLISMYTGFPNHQMFSSVFNFLNKLNINYFSGWTVQNINKKDQVLITLMKLRLNVLNDDLAQRFNCSKGTITNVVLTWVHVMHKALFERLIKDKVPSNKKNKTCMPTAFNKFTNCRIIIDCTEVQTVIPEQLNKQKLTYSNYKHKNTLKGLVGVAPNGAVTFVSDLYVGSISDKKIVQDSGILSVLRPGDLVLADKGFLIQDLLPSGVTLNIPPFLLTAQFTATEIKQTTAIARARIHVERAIRRIKIYKILNLIPATLRPHASKIFQVCSVLSNFNYPLIKEVIHTDE